MKIPGVTPEILRRPFGDKDYDQERHLLDLEDSGPLIDFIGRRSGELSGGDPHRKYEIALLVMQSLHVVRTALELDAITTAWESVAPMDAPACEMEVPVSEALPEVAPPPIDGDVAA